MMRFIFESNGLWPFVIQIIINKVKVTKHQQPTHCFLTSWITALFGINSLCNISSREPAIVLYDISHVYHKSHALSATHGNITGTLVLTVCTKFKLNTSFGAGTNFKKPSTSVKVSRSSKLGAGSASDFRLLPLFINICVCFYGFTFTKTKAQLFEGWGAIYINVPHPNWPKISPEQNAKFSPGPKAGPIPTP